MAQDKVSPSPPAGVERRCPNCGARVAREAETCFMCGYDLRIKPQRRQRVSWIDALLVAAVLAVLVLWWRMGSQPDAAGEGESAALLPTHVPLLVPTALPTPTPEPTATATPLAPEQVLITHVVKAGETLLSIGGAYGVTVEEIQQANNLADELIRAGDRLTIPVLRPGGGESSARPTANFTYTVKEGDTIISIAAVFGGTVQEILEANNLSPSDIIRPGDLLNVPVAAPSEVAESSNAAPAAAPTAGVAAEGSRLPDTLYVAPRLIGPPDGAVITGGEPALLRWVSVDLLAPNEWYVLLVYPAGGSAQTIPTVWTKSTSYRLDPALTPAEGQAADYAWQVSVVRVLPGEAGGTALEAASPPSELRRFTWQ